MDLLLTKTAYKSLLEWELINDRLLRARFHSSFQQVTIIQEFTQSNQADDDVKELSMSSYRVL
jgi:hypothetical protein